MAEELVRLADDYYSIRGDLRIGGLLNVGTQASLVRLASGDFVFLDSYTLPDAIRSEIDALTDGGRKVKAILNLHPYHTLHCEWMHQAYPQAELYGTQRHVEKFPDLPWQDTKCEDEALQEAFGEDLAFSVPDGVPLVCSDESVHFSSVLALHKKSGTIHVDDTFVYLEKGFPLSLLPMTGRLGFHPTLAKALEKRAGAADELRQWAIDLGIEWAGAQRIAAAHNAVMEMAEGEFPDLVGAALGRAKPVLDAHREQYG